MSTKQAKELGVFIRKTRKDRGLSQEQLAATSGVQLSTISRIETGEFRAPRPDKLQRLADALGLGVEDLFALAGYVTPQGLPDFPVYLRTKQELPPKARRELLTHYRELLREHGIEGGEG